MADDFVISSRAVPVQDLLRNLESAANWLIELSRDARRVRYLWDSEYAEYMHMFDNLKQVLQDDRYTPASLAIAHTEVQRINSALHQPRPRVVDPVRAQPAQQPLRRQDLFDSQECYGFFSPFPANWRRSR